MDVEDNVIHAEGASSSSSDGVSAEGSGSSSSSNPSAAMRELAVRLYNARQEGDSDNEQGEILSSALQHFAHARQLARKLALENKHDRQVVAETRSRMDAAFLAQQNRNYEIGYLYREIEKCNDYECVLRPSQRCRVQETLMHEGVVHSMSSAPSTRNYQ